MEFEAAGRNEKQCLEEQGLRLQSSLPFGVRKCGKVVSTVVRKHARSPNCPRGRNYVGQSGQACLSQRAGSRKTSASLFLHPLTHPNVKTRQNTLLAAASGLANFSTDVPERMSTMEVDRH